MSDVATEQDIIQKHRDDSCRRGMSTSAVEAHPQAQSVRFTNSDLVVDLVDGRTLSVPFAWFLRSSRATPEQLENFQIIADGEGIHWPDLDEDLSVAGLLRGPH